MEISKTNLQQKFIYLIINYEQKPIYTVLKKGPYIYRNQL